MKIVLVTGTREDCFDPFDVNDIVQDERPELIVHGDCPTGIDAHVKQWAIDMGIPQIPMPARWNYYKNSRVLNRNDAGPDRNYDMCKFVATLVVYGHEAICLGFPKGDGWSGTRDCMSKAQRWNIPVKEYQIQ